MREGQLHVLTTRPDSPHATLLFIHGLGTSSNTWVHILPALARTYRMHAVDLPGFGMSTLKHGKRFFTLQEHTNILLEYINGHVTGKFTIIGHSLGGWLAARCALSFPSRVAQLVLVNTAGVYYEGMERQRDIFLIESRHDTRKLIDLMWYRYPWYARASIGWVFRELRRRHVTDLVLSVTHDDFLNTRLRELAMPVTILWGREDRLVSPEVPVILQREVGNVTLQYIEECGHVPQLEQPTEFLRLLQAVLAKDSS